MPKPKIQILVCTNERPPDAVKPCCGARGGLDIYRKFKDVVRSEGLREQVMVVRTGCLKHCSRGVAVNLWPQNLWYQGVEPADVEEIVTRSVRAGQEVDRLRMPDIPWE